MATKTWKLGEICRGGIITVNVTKTQVVIIGKDWDTSAGWNKGSNQSNAKEWYRETIARPEDTMEYDWMSMRHPEWKTSALDALNYLTTGYYADEIVKWIESKI